MSNSEIIVLELVITWILGLLPAILIRHAFVKQPLSPQSSKWIAAGISIFYYVFFKWVQFVNDLPPSSGFVWVLIFFVNCWVLTSKPDSESDAVEEIIGRQQHPEDDELENDELEVNSEPESSNKKKEYKLGSSDDPWASS